MPDPEQYLHVEIRGLETFQLFCQIVRDDDTTARHLQTLSTQLASLIFENRQQGEEIMAKFDEMSAVLDIINVRTNETSEAVGQVVAAEATQLAELQRLRDLVAQGGVVTAEQFDSLIARASGAGEALTVVRDALLAIAASPTDPAPPLPEITPVE